MSERYRLGRTAPASLRGSVVEVLRWPPCPTLDTDAVWLQFDDGTRLPVRPSLWAGWRSSAEVVPATPTPATAASGRLEEA